MDGVHLPGRGVNELIEAYRQGEDRTALAQEARHLRVALPNSDEGEAFEYLPIPLLHALFSPRDTLEPSVDTTIRIPTAVGEDINVIHVCGDLINTEGARAVLFVLDDHLILILVNINNAGDEEFFAYTFVRSRDTEALIGANLSTTTLLPFHPIRRDQLNLRGLYVYEEELTATFDDMIDLLVTQRSEERVVAWSRSGLHFSPERVGEFPMFEEVKYMDMTELADVRSRIFFSFLIINLYMKFQTHNFPPPARYHLPGASLGDGLPEPGHFRRERKRQRNWVMRGPHVVLRSLVAAGRAAPARSIARRPYANLYADLPESLFREVVEFV